MMDAPHASGDSAAPTFEMDGQSVEFKPGQTILQAALEHGHYVPYLCYHPEFKPHGSCKVCVVRVNGRTCASCTTPAQAGDVVEATAADLVEMRTSLVQFLFTEGNHFCPSCELSGNCRLQAIGYELRMASAYYNPLFPDRPVDGSHPEILLDFNRCILCELCVRASALVDKKNVFSLAGRGIRKHLIVNAESGRLADTNAAADDKAMSVCPVGVILPKRRGFRVPIGQRTYDQHSVAEVPPVTSTEER